MARLNRSPLVPGLNWLVSSPSHLRAEKHWKRDFALAGVLLASSAVASCTTPYEQLQLPTPISAPSGTEPDRPNETEKGLLLSRRGDPTANRQHTYAGSGEFTSDAGVVRVNGNKDAAAKTQSPASPTSTTSADGISINLAGASIAEVAKTVLGDILGYNYSVSDKLKGAITLRTAHPVSKSSLLEIFESVLRNEGAVLVVRGDLYQVMPAADAAANGTPLRRPSKSSAAGLGIATEIVPLRYVTATEMERVLRSAAPQAAILRVDTARNLVVLSGTTSELSALRELVDVFDVDWMRGMSFGLFPIEAADPEAIAKELDTIFANDHDSPTKGLTRFIGNRRLKSILVIATRPEYLRKAETWIARIDKVNQATQKQVHVYHVQHRAVAELGKLLQRVYGGQTGGGDSANGGQASGSRATALDQAAPVSALATGSGSNTSGSSATAGSLAAAAQVSPATSPGGNGLPAGATATQGGAALPADAAAPESAGHLSSGQSASQAATDDRSAGISVVADEPNNSLVVTATTSEYRRVLQILETLDTQPNEVLLEATIAEVTLNDQINFGVRWFFQNSAASRSLGFTDAANATVPGPLSGLSYFVNGTNIKVLLNALSTVTDVNVLSQPSLMVLENKKATLQVGDEVPILTQTQQSAAVTGTPTISNAVSYRNTGILLGITPRVGNDGRVLLEIEQEVSDTKSNTTSGIDSPSFSQRRVKTTIAVQDGQTIVLAGMIQDKATRSRDQVPLLGNIPLLGNAFKTKTDSVVRTELMIAITPQVIKDSQQINAVTAEFRDSLNMSTRPQRTAQPDRREDISRLIR